MGTTRSAVVLDLGDEPETVRGSLQDLWAHREVLSILARSDFQVRYKRASFGILWAVVVPLLQAAVLAVVFSEVLNVGSGTHFGAYVMSGVLAWAYFSAVTGTGATAIVDGSGLTDKVWFPRALLPLVASLANLPGLGVSMLALIVAMPLLGVGLGPRILLLLPACLLLIAFSTALTLVLSALHVYFRDVRFLIQAALLVWFYLTPIAYPRSLVGRLGPVIDANPMTGVVAVFRLATVGAQSHWAISVTVAVATTVVLLAAALEIYRRHDRLFVDLL